MTKRVITVIGILITVYPIGQSLYTAYRNLNSGRSLKSSQRFETSPKSSAENVSHAQAQQASNTTGESGKHRTLLPSEQLEKISSSGDLRKNKPAKAQPFEKQLIRDNSQYVYCFSTIQGFGPANQGLFHIYKKDSNTFLIKLMLSSGQSRFPEEGMLLSMDKSSSLYIDHELGMLILKRNIKKEIATWLKSD